MNHYKFRRRLNELAITERDRCGTRNLDWDNHTLPLKIVEFKTKHKPCEFECGKSVKDQRIQYYNPFNEGWLKKCVNCGLWQDPATGLMRDAQTLKSVFMRKRLPFRDGD